MNLDGASYKVEDGEGLRRILHVRVPAPAIQEEFLTRLGAVRRRTKIRGFRPGKAPIKLIRQRYGKDVWNELIRETIERSFRAGAQHSRLRVVGSGEVKAKQVREGSDLEYHATFDVFPDIEWKGLDELTYDEPEVEIQARDVDRTIDRLRRRDAEWKDLERTAQDGDRMVVSLRASRRRQTLEAGELKEVTLMLGETRLMPGLKERLMRLSASRKKKFRLKMPADYPDESLRGKRVLYEVEVVGLSEPELPDLDEEFVRKLGVESGSVDDLRANVKATLERELNSVRDSHRRQSLFDQLLAANAGPTPKSLVDQDIEQMLAGLRPRLRKTRRRKKARGRTRRRPRRRRSRKAKCRRKPPRCARLRNAAFGCACCWRSWRHARRSAPTISLCGNGCRRWRPARRTRRPHSRNLPAIPTWLATCAPESARSKCWNGSTSKRTSPANP